MNKQSSDNSTDSKLNGSNSYFESSQHNRDTDFTEVLDFESVYDNIKNDVNEKVSDTQLDFNKKIEIMLEYRRELFVNHMKIIHEKSFVDLNVNMDNIIFSRRKTFSIFVEVPV